MRRSLVALLLGALLAPGCGGDSGPGDEVLAALDAYARGPSRIVALASAMVTPGALFVAAPDDNLLAAISGRLGTETSGCARREQTPSALTVTFAPQATSTCTLQTGMLGVTGTMTVTIARDGSTVRFLTALDLVVDGEPLTDQLVLVTSDGNGYTYNVLASLAGHGMKIPMLGGQPSGGAVTSTATGETRGLVPTATLAWDSVSQRLSACHPHSGTLTYKVAAEAIERALVFTDESPARDKALYREGEATVEVTLPHLPGCPPVPES